MINVPMPRLSEAMAEGKLLAWNVAVGDFVSAGDILAEIEADKANMEIESPCPGRVVALSGNPGDMVPVDQVLVEIDDRDVSGVVQPIKPSSPSADSGDDVGRSPLAERLKKFEAQ